MRHPIGTECVIVAPLAAKCLGDVVTVIGDLDAHIPGMQQITTPARTNYPQFENHFWRPEWLRPFDEDITSDDGDVVRSMVHKPLTGVQALLEGPAADWRPVTVEHQGFRFVAQRGGRQVFWYSINDPYQW